jgi:hypothetical protein
VPKAPGKKRRCDSTLSQGAPGQRTRQRAPSEGRHKVHQVLDARFGQGAYLEIERRIPRKNRAPCVSMRLSACGTFSFCRSVSPKWMASGKKKRFCIDVQASWQSGHGAENSWPRSSRSRHSSNKSAEEDSYVRRGDLPASQDYVSKLVLVISDWASLRPVSGERQDEWRRML